METAKPDPNIKWCDKCGRYFNSNAPHECIDEDLNKNREQLEQYLGRYKVKEEG